MCVPCVSRTEGIMISKLIVYFGVAPGNEIYVEMGEGIENMGVTHCLALHAAATDLVCQCVAQNPGRAQDIIRSLLTSMARLKHGEPILKDTYAKMIQETEKN